MAAPFSPREIQQQIMPILRSLYDQRAILQEHGAASIISGNILMIDLYKLLVRIRGQHAVLSSTFPSHSIELLDAVFSNVHSHVTHAVALSVLGHRAVYSVPEDRKILISDNLCDAQIPHLDNTSPSLNTAFYM